MNMLHGRIATPLLCAASLLAQNDPFDQVELRVASLRPAGQLVVDRGERDLVRVDDRVVLLPRNGPTITGRVVEVESRTALVELLDPTADVPVGTRGHVLVPKARRADAPPRPVPPDPTRPPEVTAPQEEEWQPGMPLLGSRRAPRPEERVSRLRGRVYAAANAVRTLDSFDQSFLDAGVDVDIDNLGNTGGTLRFWGEFNWSEETNDRTGTDLRIYEFAYEHGGTRFEPFRWQVGRFLQRDMPEFGILDGAEFGYRSEGGDRFGVSVGYLPELDEDMDTAEDLQVAAWYVWNQDMAERLQVAVGYQKTWNRGDEDRDLVVVRTRVLPDSGWDFSGAIWVDLYNGDDQNEDGYAVTRANVFASRRWQGEGGIEFFYEHEEYPETLRREIPQNILPLTLLEAHLDRVSLHAFTFSEDGTRWFGRITGWTDEERTGGAYELGVEFVDWLAERSRTALVGFQAQGLTNNLHGVRIQHGGSYGSGRLDLLYELAFVHHEGFPDDRDDLFQHRLGALVATDLGGQWNANLFADSTLYDEELSFGVGLFLQRHF